MTKLLCLKIVKTQQQHEKHISGKINLTRSPTDGWNYTEPNFPPDHVYFSVWFSGPTFRVSVSIHSSPYSRRLVLNKENFFFLPRVLGLAWLGVPSFTRCTRLIPSLSQPASLFCSYKGTTLFGPTSEQETSHACVTRVVSRKYFIHPPDSNNSNYSTHSSWKQPNRNFNKSWILLEYL